MSSPCCPGCGGVFGDSEGPVHRYMTCTAGCWGGFGGVLAGDYSSPARMNVHQVVVDAYAAQHPGDGSRPQQVQSVGLHLMTLCLFLEHGTDPGLGTALHRKMVGRPGFTRLERAGVGELTWAHLPQDGTADEFRGAAYEWAESVWRTYREAWPTVRTWLRDAGFDLSAKAPVRPLHG